VGYNARNDEIRDNVTRMQRDFQAQREALATVRRFRAVLSAKGRTRFWPDTEIRGRAVCVTTGLERGS
jgi:hypothetical protein